ncbi:MAG: shikimate dehydrogenase [Gemmatimonadota bacterium]|nr:shikimate dehydrogenase [Gemmatimonadota bacterium]
MNPRPGRLVLLGHPVAHSLSPRIQNAALRRAGIPLVYEALDVPPADLGRTLGTLRAIGAAGNVTIPHKEAVAAHCDGLTPVARRAGAVNTFWCGGGRLIGDNTDVGGFEVVAANLLGRPEGMRSISVALLGAGGAAAAVLVAVERWTDARVRVFSRSGDRTRRLCARFPGLAEAVETADDAVRGADLVVNATPIGLTDDLMPIDPARLEPGAAAIDLVYRRGGTPWTRAATRLGRRAVDGTAVLLEQGALAFERWFGLAPDRTVMREALSQ